MSLQTAASKPFVSPRQDLAEFYRSVRTTTQQLVADLSPEDQMVQSMPDASPAKWHLAHTTWFFETFVLSRIPSYKPRDERFRIVFNSYYKGVGSHPLRSTRGNFSRPSLAEILEYRSYIDDAIGEVLQRNMDKELADLIELGCHHEQQHQELIATDVKHALWSQPLQPVWLASPLDEGGSPAPLTWNSFPGGVFEIGHSGDGFAYDNESPRHEVLLKPFKLSSRLITNAEYCEFIADSAYERPELWLSDGWDTVQQQGWKAPLYWEKRDEEYWTFTTHGLQRLDPNEPVCHVSYYEADAYARWRGARLPYESEWEVVAQQQSVRGNFLDSRRLHPAAASGHGLQQMFGDAWEWTASPYTGYPGFRPSAGAIGEYNGKFMCNQFVLRGGSCATPRSHIRATYRNFFPPHARWQFMGIRLASDQD